MYGAPVAVAPGVEHLRDVLRLDRADRARLALEAADELARRRPGRG